eukprot:1679955-Rhodomonas_salina.2
MGRAGTWRVTWSGGGRQAVERGEVRAEPPEPAPPLPPGLYRSAPPSCTHTHTAWHTLWAL